MYYRINKIESHNKVSPGMGITENHLHSRLSKRQALAESLFSIRPELCAQHQPSPSGAVGKRELQELSPLQAQPSSDSRGMWEIAAAAWSFLNA